MRSPRSATYAGAGVTDGSRPGYLVAGAGAPVVLLHASLGSKSQWSALAERLAARFRVIAIDLWGYGDNTHSPLPEPFTLDEEVRLVMDRLGPLVGPQARVHFVGHSYGGLVALRLAHRQRHRVASLSLYEPVVFRLLGEDDPDRATTEQLANRVDHLVRTGSPREAVRAFVDFWSGDGTYRSQSLPAQASLARRAGKIPLDFAAASSWPLDSSDLRSIMAPALLMVGNRGPVLIQRIVDRLATCLPDVRVAPFDCGHMGPVTDPVRVNPWIEAFIELCAERETSHASSPAGGTPSPDAAAGHLVPHALSTAGRGVVTCTWTPTDPP